VVVVDKGGRKIVWGVLEGGYGVGFALVERACARRRKGRCMYALLFHVLLLLLSLLMSKSEFLWADSVGVFVCLGSRSC